MKLLFIFVFYFLLYTTATAVMIKGTTKSLLLDISEMINDNHIIYSLNSNSKITTVCYSSDAINSFIFKKSKNWNKPFLLNLYSPLIEKENLTESDINFLNNSFIFNSMNSNELQQKTNIWSSLYQLAKENSPISHQFMIEKKFNSFSQFLTNLKKVKINDKNAVITKSTIPFVKTTNQLVIKTLYSVVSNDIVIPLKHCYYKTMLTTQGYDSLVKSVIRKHVDKATPLKDKISIAKRDKNAYLNSLAIRKTNNKSIDVVLRDAEYYLLGRFAVTNKDWFLVSGITVGAPLYQFAKITNKKLKNYGFTWLEHLLRTDKNKPLSNPGGLDWVYKGLYDGNDTDGTKKEDSVIEINIEYF